MSGHRKRTHSSRAGENPWFRDPDVERDSRRSADPGYGSLGSGSRRHHGSHRRSSYKEACNRVHSPKIPSGPRAWSPPPTSRHSRPPRPDLDEVEDGEIPAVLEYVERPPLPPRAPRADRESSKHAIRRSGRRSSPTPRSIVPREESSKSDVKSCSHVMARSPTPEKPQLSPEEILAQARAKRLAILAKHASATPTITAAHHIGSVTPAAESGNVSITKGLNTPAANLHLDSEQPVNSASEQGCDSVGGSPALATEDAFDLAKDTDPSKPVNHDVLTNGEQNVSSADYNPDDDRRVDDQRQLQKNGPGGPGTVGVIAQAERQTIPNAILPTDRSLEHLEGDGEEQDCDDEDDDDDMFAVEPRKPKKRMRMSGPSTTLVPVFDRAGDMGTSLVADNFDDADGYYRFLLGELLDSGRYHVHANLGRGMFASVVRARDTQARDGDAEVAIKVIRSQESMYKAGQKEAAILRKLQDADPSAKYHVVRLHRTFEHRGHLCLVFESMSMNLREVIKRYGKDVGINLRAVRAYAHQVFLGLSLMKKCNIMHADLKPDNILVNETKAVLKVCDLGSASDVSENDITPYLVSRFYRAPEIILGLPYDFSIDIWSIGCTLYELYTGKILFPGRSNNHLLLLIMELKGKLNSKMIKKAKFAQANFDEAGNFLCVEKNKVTGADTVKPINISSKPTHGLPAKLMPLSVTRKMQDGDLKLLTAFVDLLDKMLSLDPSKRITPKEALNHPFIRM